MLFSLCLLSGPAEACYPSSLRQKPTAPLATSATGRLAMILFQARLMNLLEYFKGKTSVCATCFQDLLFFKCYLEKLLFWAWEGKRGLLWEGVSFPHIPKWTEASSERPGKWRGERGSGGAENLEPTVKSARSSSHCQIQFKKIQTAPERAKWVQCKNVLSLLSSVTAKNPLPFGRAVRAFPRKPHKLHIFLIKLR